MTISVVTTFHKSGYEQYGRRMINTFLQNWPKSVKLYVYAEDCTVIERADNLIVTDLHSASPELVAFKQKHKDDPKARGDISGVPRLSSRKDSHKPFKWDAIRFSHKVYAIFDCARQCGDTILFWMDADTVCHSPITEEKILEMAPLTIDLGFLGREKKFSECGLYSMNLTSDRVRGFLRKFQNMYDDADNGIFTLDEWHDSYVFDAVRKQCDLVERNWSQGIISGEGHPLINCEWGAYLDHLKGDRKSVGKSLNKDLRTKRSENYWLS